MKGLLFCLSLAVLQSPAQVLGNQSGDLLKFHVTSQGDTPGGFERPPLRFMKITLDEFPDRPRLQKTLDALTSKLLTGIKNGNTLVEASVLVEGKPVLHASQTTSADARKPATTFHRDRFAPQLILTEAERKQVFWRSTILEAREILKLQSGGQPQGADATRAELGAAASALPGISNEAEDKHWPNATLSGPMKDYAKEWENPLSPSAVAMKKLNAKPKMMLFNPSQLEAVYKLSRTFGHSPSEVAQKLEVTEKAVLQLNRIAKENRWDVH